MKPKEFDDLVRQKFDQNDFAYNPANWDELAEKLDGKEKKRSMIMWWWVPLAGMAASVALAFGVSGVLRQAMRNSNDGSVAHHAQKGNTSHQQVAQSNTFSFHPETVQNEVPGNDDIYSSAVASNTRRHKADAHKRVAVTKHVTRSQSETDADEGFKISFKSATATIVKHKKIDLVTNTTTDVNKKKVVVNDAVATFIPEEAEKVKKAPKLSIILSGGVNHGNQNSGYMAGATIRRMISDKVYIESDVAFASSNNTQSTAYAEEHTISTGKVMNTAKTSSVEGNKATPVPTTYEVIKQKDISYDLYYAQVTPSIGYKVIKRMSIGVGPDFQRMLVDNRPAPSSVDRGTVQVAPVFDVGFVGKSEYALTKKVKAGFYYRKGVNNIITPTGKYIDRDYMQFQVKYTIFNK